MIQKSPKTDPIPFPLITLVAGVMLVLITLPGML